MAKSLRSKWKRKMRAIKREKMDVKVLDRLKNMLAASEVEQKLDAQEAQTKEKKKKKNTKDVVEMAEPTEPAETVATSETEETTMEVEGETATPKKTRKPNLKTLRNEKNQFPIWMTTKKIHRQAKLQKRIIKRKTKEAKMARTWKTACSV